MAVFVWVGLSENRGNASFAEQLRGWNIKTDQDRWIENGSAKICGGTQAYASVSAFLVTITEKRIRTTANVTAVYNQEGLDKYVVELQNTHVQRIWF